MKKNVRVLMGILFPFVLILTVTSISKALKPEKNQLNREIPVKLESKSNPATSTSVSVSLTKHPTE